MILLQYILITIFLSHTLQGLLTSHVSCQLTCLSCTPAAAAAYTCPRIGCIRHPVEYFGEVAAASGPFEEMAC